MIDFINVKSNWYRFRTTFSAIASLDDMGNPEVIPSIEENRKITIQQFMLMDQMLLLVQGIRLCR